MPIPQEKLTTVKNELERLITAKVSQVSHIEMAFVWHFTVVVAQKEHFL